MGQEASLCRGFVFVASIFQEKNFLIPSNSRVCYSVRFHLFGNILKVQLFLSFVFSHFFRPEMEIASSVDIHHPKIRLIRGRRKGTSQERDPDF